MTAHVRDVRGTEMTAAASQGFATALHDRSRRPTGTLYRRFGKRLFDISFVVITAPVGLGLIALGAVLAMASGVRPFYRQRRVGRDGRIFQMIKIRSMVEDADARLEQHLRDDPVARKEWDEFQKLTQDPRIVRYGQFLRRTSLDEMPQLWNVLRGDMSLVGPRPIMETQQEIYHGVDYSKMRPGITGLWQITDRSSAGFASRCTCDSAYWRVMSLTEDLRILSHTVGAVLKRTGK